MRASLAIRQRSNEEFMIRCCAPKLKAEGQYTPVRSPMTAKLGDIALFNAMTRKVN